MIFSKASLDNCEPLSEASKFSLIFLYWDASPLINSTFSCILFLASSSLIGLPFCWNNPESIRLFISESDIAEALSRILLKRLNCPTLSNIIMSDIILANW